MTASPRPPRVDESEGRPSGVDRRGFLGWVLAAPTLLVGASAFGALAGPEAAGAAILSPPEPADLYDLSDLITDATLPTSMLVKVGVETDGTVTYALPRAEVGQGLTTAVAMIIADGLDVPLDHVRVTLADARPELIWNQFTGSSSSVHTLYRPLRAASALARQRLIAAAAARWSVAADTLTTRNGVVHGSNGRSAGYGSLSAAAAASTLTAELVSIDPDLAQRVVGSPRSRIDALAAVTGRKVFTLDLAVPNALPTMVHRPPTINATVASVANLAAVRAMPGVTHVGVISTGVAVRARTFGQCVDAVRALSVTWAGGTVNGQSDATVLARLKKAEIPLLVPKVPLLAKTVEGSFTFYFRSNSPLETNCAVADVRPGSAEVWASLKNPIVTQQTIAKNLGLKQNQVRVHVSEGGGSFGRHLFSDAAYEAVEASRLFGKPVRLMWHRTDDFRHGRTHPMATSRVRATVLGGNVLTYEQRHTSVATDFTHGLGEILLATGAKLPGGNLTFAQTVFMLTQSLPYNFGVTSQLLSEVYRYDTFHTGSMRNIYSPDVATARELITDQIAAKVGKDPFTFRKAFVKEVRMRAVLAKLGQVGNWGRAMPPGTAQGIALHSEYKSRVGALVEIDCRPATVNRQVPDAQTGPRVTKVVVVVDVGLTINPRGLEAQMQGGAMDGIATALTSSLHLVNGHFAEGSWDHYFYTRQWNVPPEVQVVIMPDTTGSPGGAGELSAGVVMAAVACAYARATGVMPTQFPINHNQPLGFVPLPTVPPIPQSPTDGLAHAF
ncbi:MAG: isoquinoline 1-oxidoreductase subunit beta [Pseudonocardiales bacterium]|nr:isoquinoline 1-oxidoreductase subunit beta [Pseudonocardiales bacterium]